MSEHDNGQTEPSRLLSESEFRQIVAAVLEEVLEEVPEMIDILVGDDFATKDDVRDFTVTVSRMDEQYQVRLDNVETPVLKGTAHHPAHVIAVPQNTEARKKPRDKGSSSTQIALLDTIQGYGFGTALWVIALACFAWWSLVQSGCHRLLDTVDRTITTVTMSAADAVDTDVHADHVEATVEGVLKVDTDTVETTPPNTVRALPSDTPQSNPAP